MKMMRKEKEATEKRNRTSTDKKTQYFNNYEINIRLDTSEKKSVNWHNNKMTQSKAHWSNEKLWFSPSGQY